MINKTRQKQQWLVLKNNNEKKMFCTWHSMCWVLFQAQTGPVWVKLKNIYILYSDTIQHHLYNILFTLRVYPNIFCYSKVKRHFGRFVWQHEIHLLTLRLWEFLFFCFFYFQTENDHHIPVTESNQLSLKTVVFHSEPKAIKVLLKSKVCFPKK